MPDHFEVTWDYLCPFARNAHEHLVAAISSGATWTARFRFFSLAQAHLDEGKSVWEDPLSHSGVLAGLAGIVVREQYPERFPQAHIALFTARHDESKDLRDSDVVIAALGSVGLDGATIVKEALSDWAIEMGRRDHDESVQQWEVFGVPTFIADDKAVFVRLMTRPEGDGELARRTVQGVLDLFDNFPELNEYKFTQITR
ncbi:MAG TPA: DsbA family protein [Acidimicrobiales bacterium]|nr:DsbA family protein [Acidimicrobiales bacterium]